MRLIVCFDCCLVVHEDKVLEMLGEVRLKGRLEGGERGFQTQEKREGVPMDGP